MQPNLSQDSPPRRPDPPRRETADSLLEVIEDLVPEALHLAAWGICSGSGWRFGNGSHESDRSQSWTMDLDGDSVFNSIWEHARPRCEALAGGPLRVVRQYAHGHTYGLGGQPNQDDHQPGSYTLLYYPNPEWQDGWDGETVYYDAAGEIALAVRPRPNRAVFFDSRIPHAGRAPSRLCPALRVTVEYEVQVAEPTRTSVEDPASCKELTERREGASRVYHLRVGSAVVERSVEEHLAQLGNTVRLPGFRPGKIPAAVLRQRYGIQARTEAAKRIAGETAQKMLPKQCILASIAFQTGAESGDLEFQATATYLPDLAAPDFSALSIERLSATAEDLKSANLSDADAEMLFRRHLKLQVLDHLDAACAFPILPFLINREFATIWNAAETQSGIPADAAERESFAAELRAIAERRVRLGVVVAELGRRMNVQSENSAELEDKVVDLIVSRARTQQRRAGIEELRELAATV